MTVRMPLSSAFRPSTIHNEYEEEEEERLHGITRQDQVDHLLQTWYECKPELDVTRMAYKPKACITWEDINGKALFSEV